MKYNDPYDVIVVGGGSAGIGAALSAARNGARTLLVERSGVGGIGGVATTGLVISWGARIRFWDRSGNEVLKGIPWEIHSGIIQEGGGTRHALHFETAPEKTLVDVEVFKKVVLERLMDAGVEMLFHTLMCDVVLADRKIQGIVVENESGRQRLLARQVIDATGDGDVCVRSGVPYTNTAGKHTLMFLVGGVDFKRVYEYLEQNKSKMKEQYWDHFDREWKKGYMRFGTCNLDDLKQMEPYREIFEKAIAENRIEEDALYGYGIPSARIPSERSPLDWGYDMQGMEGWVESDFVDVWGLKTRFDGTDDVSISKYEALGYRRNWQLYEQIIKKMPGFEGSRLIRMADSIGIRSSRKIATEFDFTMEDAEKAIPFEDAVFNYFNPNYPDAKVHQMPYRQFLPVGVDNCYLIGRPNSLFRSIPTCLAQGEAAGTAAAMASKQGITSREIDMCELRDRLKSAGAVIGDSLNRSSTRRQCKKELEE